MKDKFLKLRAQCAADLGVNNVKDQAVHRLMVVRETKRLHEEHDGDWKLVFAGLCEIGHGFTMNASQFNQWLDRKEDGSGKSMDLSDLDI